jgi:hypothetical protein
MNIYRGSGVIAPPILNLGTRELSGQRHAVAALVPGNRLSGLRVGPDIKTNLCFPESWTPDHSERSRDAIPTTVYHKYSYLSKHVPCTYKAIYLQPLSYPAIEQNCYIQQLNFRP